VFNLCDVLQECNPVLKQDLPILHLLLLLAVPAADTAANNLNTNTTECNTFVVN